MLTPDQLRQAVTGEEITTLTRVPGIGRKGAERLIIELRDRVTPVSGAGTTATPGAGPAMGGSTQTAAREHVIQALVGLGFTAQNAGQAVTAVTADEPTDAPLDQARTLRAALTRLGGSR